MRVVLLLCMLCSIKTPALAGTVVDLDQDQGLKALFDAGLRPVHVRGLEARMVELESPQEIVFKVGGLTLPPLTAKWSFRVYSIGKLSSINGYVQDPWGKEQTYNELSKWEKAFGFENSLPDLRKWLDDFPSDSQGPDLWGRAVFQKRVPGDQKVSYYLRHSFQEPNEKPFLMTVHLERDLGPQKQIFGTEPL